MNFRKLDAKHVNRDITLEGPRCGHTMSVHGGPRTPAE